MLSDALWFWVKTYHTFSQTTKKQTNKQTNNYLTGKTQEMSVLVNLDVSSGLTHGVLVFLRCQRVDRRSIATSL